MAATELAVVGAGPAGLAAAVTAARLGRQVILVDEQTSPGGQYLKGVSETGPVSATERAARAWLEALGGLPVEVRSETLVWNLARPGDGGSGLHLDLVGPGGLTRLEARAAILATGGRELVLPFPGWTLPGVMTAGAAQVLAKGSGMLPGRRIVIAGSGPLLLAVAAELAERGAAVAAVLEATQPSQWLRYGSVLWGNGDRLGEGWTYSRRLIRARIPYRFGRTVIRALGAEQLEGVVVARLDRQSRPMPGSEERLTADTLCLGFGFVPNAELAQLAGCTLVFQPAQGGWVPAVNGHLETSVPGLFVAGETAGIGGAAAALIEGELAGLAAAVHVAGPDIAGAKLERRLAALSRRRRPRQRFGAMLNTLFVPGPGLAGLMTPDTPVCRCEEVTAGEIRAALAQGASELDALKIWTHAGQGLCQGRVCGPLLARLLAWQTGRDVAEAGYFRVRPPLKPIPLGQLAGGGYG